MGEIIIQTKWLWMFGIVLVLIVANTFIFKTLYAELHREPLENVKSNITSPVYVSVYMGDIDGAVSDNWYPFYEKVIDFHEQNQIPITLSVYPNSIQDNKKFNHVMERMYTSEYVEIMQKGFNGNETEMRMAELPYEQQYEIIKAGQDHFRKKMSEILGIPESEVKVPTDYNQIGASFSNETMNAAESLGFNFYFDIYTGDDVNSVSSTNSFDVTEYGVSFTANGEAGNENPFNTPNKIFKDINTFSREDLKTLAVDGDPFIPIWTHQQDFENVRKENVLDEQRWEIYIKTLLALKNDPNVKFMLPSEAYALRHQNGSFPKDISKPQKIFL